MTLPVPTTGERLHVRAMTTSIAIAIMMLIVQIPARAETTDPASNRLNFQEKSDRSVPSRAEDSDRFVYDYAGALTREQSERHKFDLDRLRDAGIPVVVYIRRSDDSKDESVAFADLLRNEWRLESAPGADDGIVILVTLSDLSPLRDSLVMSLGPNALPIGQLDAERLQEIYDTEMQPAFRKDEIDLAVSYGVRRILYYEGYTPPDPASLSESQTTARSLAPWTILLAGLSGVASLISTDERSRVFGRFRPLVGYRRLHHVVPGTLLIASVALCVHARSATWLTVSVLVAIVLGLVIRLSASWREWRTPGPTVVHVRSRGRRVGRSAMIASRNRQRLRNA